MPARGRREFPLLAPVARAGGSPGAMAVFMSVFLAVVVVMVVVWIRRPPPRAAALLLILILFVIGDDIAGDDIEDCRPAGHILRHGTGQRIIEALSEGLGQDSRRLIMEW